MTHTPRTRDAALRKLKSVNRWVIAGSAALTGIFTAVAANAFPGHTVKTGSSATGGSSSSTRSGSSGLRPPARSPESSEGSPESSEGSEAEGSTQPREGGESTVPGESSAPAESTTPSESTVPSQESGEATPRGGEAEVPAEAVPAEPEAPVVSGGS